MSHVWSFPDPEDTEVITLERILLGVAPILLVTHDSEDGGWQFLDGEQVFEEDGVVVGLGEVVQFDPSLHELANLPIGWHAWRMSPQEPWQRAKGDVPGSSVEPTAEVQADGAAESKNIEIKACIADVDLVCELIEAISDTDVEILDQEDLFFATPTGRLKLRILGEDSGELIHYQRTDSTEPRASCYRIAPTSAPHVMRAILGNVLPVLGTVSKRRRLYRLGQTRIHLDQVHQLGDFVELEVVLRPGQSEEEGIAIARSLMDRLGIASDQIVDKAYFDLLTASSSSGSLSGESPA